MENTGTSNITISSKDLSQEGYAPYQDDLSPRSIFICKKCGMIELNSKTIDEINLNKNAKNDYDFDFSDPDNE